MINSILIYNLFLNCTFIFLDSGGNNSSLGINGSMNVCKELELPKSISLLIGLIFIGIIPFFSCNLFKRA